MPATEYVKSLDKWLTTFNKTSKTGDVHTITIGSESKTKPGRTCQFTRVTLGPIAMTGKYGPMFDLDTCVRECPLDVT